MPLRFAMVDLRDVVEALFFSTGPNCYSFPGATIPCEPRGNLRMQGWVGNVTVRLGGLNGAQESNARRELDLLEEAMGGAANFTVAEASPSIEPTHVAREMRVVASSALVDQQCPTNAVGCASTHLFANPSEGTRSVVIVVDPTADPGTIAHEIGHAFGLSHMQWASWNSLSEVSMPILGYPLMFPTSQISREVSTDVELQAIASVYRAGLRGGAPRSSFSAIGLIRNP